MLGEALGTLTSLWDLGLILVFLPVIVWGVLLAPRSDLSARRLLLLAIVVPTAAYGAAAFTVVHSLED